MSKMEMWPWCINTMMLNSLIWLFKTATIFCLVSKNAGTNDIELWNNLRWSFILIVTFVQNQCVTWLFSFAQHRTAPGSRPNAIEGLNAQLVLHPLLKALNCHLSRKAVRNCLHPGLPKSVCSLCTYTVTYTFRISVISWLWKWLQKIWRKTLGQERLWYTYINTKTPKLWFGF